MNTAIIWLADEQAGDAQMVGGKGAGLHQLARLEVPVPPGFVVSTAAYRSYLDGAGLRAPITEAISRAETVQQQARVAEQIRSWFEQTQLGESLRQEVVDACETLGNCPVAVRSSATAEDTAEASFAGQQESYLWVQGCESITEHIVKCWSSLFTPQAIAYRNEHHVAAAAADMGVVVQRMVPASVAGVMMTLDPVNGDPSQICIEASYGLGLGVVAGEVTPDRFTVDKVGMGIRAREPHRKPQAYRFDEQSRSVVSVEVPPEEQDSLCLTDDEVRNLAELGKNIEQRLGKAQDIEWALDLGDPGTRTPYLVQTRPETVWTQQPPATIASTGSTAIDRMVAMMNTPVRLKD